ncbi:unnamed protein product [Fusarium venenatum]|uniref:Uncharacterized protein n=1 Tax=Fusarium venenatum TaxID=56646 RepID=A0A2L2T227_9HYPO|nr:uncharacterized protein FVRRES_00190 [Fusarium venenatum]CEI63678.1 unnamed protein product [Fusarium venenatum]
MDPWAEANPQDRYCFVCGHVNRDRERLLMHKACVDAGIQVQTGFCYRCGNSSMSAIDLFCPDCGPDCLPINETVIWQETHAPPLEPTQLACVSNATGTILNEEDEDELARSVRKARANAGPGEHW